VTEHETHRPHLLTWTILILGVMLVVGAFCFDRPTPQVEEDPIVEPASVVPVATAPTTIRGKDLPLDTVQHRYMEAEDLAIGSWGWCSGDENYHPDPPSHITITTGPHRWHDEIYGVALGADSSSAKFTLTPSNTSIILRFPQEATHLWVATPTESGWQVLGSVSLMTSSGVDWCGYTGTIKGLPGPEEEVVELNLGIQVTDDYQPDDHQLNWR